jgi:hypothetical protein
MTGRVCKAPKCAAEIADKSRSKYCKACRGPNTHGIKPAVRFFAEAVQ